MNKSSTFLEQSITVNMWTVDKAYGLLRKQLQKLGNDDDAEWLIKIENMMILLFKCLFSKNNEYFNTVNGTDFLVMLEHIMRLWSTLFVS